MIVRHGVKHGSGFGCQRWVVERGFAHLHNFRRLPIRYERDPASHTAFLTLACSILCWRRLTF
jgi:transposase